jgi:photosystem II stability/assembly factor-like uncharacterized protein
MTTPLSTGYRDEICTSQDQGRHWKRVGQAWQFTDLWGIAVNTKGDVFAALSDEIRVCKKGTGRWEKTNLGKLDANVRAIVCDKKDRLFAAASSHSTHRAVMVSGNWPPPLGPMNTREAPFLRSVDGGKTWVRLRPDAECFNAYCLAVGPKNEIVAATIEGVFVSRDAGAHWEWALDTSYKGPNHRGDPIEKVAVDKDGRIFAVGHSDLFVCVPARK